MAEEVLVVPALTQEMIDEGQRLVDVLDTHLFPDCFWQYEREPNEWRLTFSSPKIDTEGPRKLYTQIQRDLASLSPPANHLRLRVITVVGHHDPIVESLRAMKKGNVTMEFSGKRINWFLSDAAYVYRLRGR